MFCESMMIHVKVEWSLGFSVARLLKNTNKKGCNDIDDLGHVRQFLGGYNSNVDSDSVIL